MPHVEVNRIDDAPVGAVWAEVTLYDAGSPIGRADVARGNDSSTVAVTVVDGDHEERVARLVALLRSAIDVVAEEGGGDVHWWVHGATAVEDAAALAAGFAPGRQLLQLRRPLPTGIPVEVVTRAFEPGGDEAAWVAVNNRAFAGHPEQGGWDVDALTRREAEPWFDPDGFRLHERDGRLAAFCWTKLHPPGTEDASVVGEIYVIGVDPDFQGLSLGRQLTLAGLHSIARRDVPIGMLYVDAANATARKLYDRLGFALHRTDQAYSTTVVS